ncbi:MAG TPA: GtrA family protein, partial [Roseiarcus sp.]
MNAVKPAAPAHGRIAEQVPAFAAIGVTGYFIDATITFLCAKYFGLSPELARPPGFIVATIVNFFLNRSITFRHAQAPLAGSFVRYCGVASVGLAVNYAVYSACVVLAPIAGIAVTPAILPLFVAAGSGVA